MQRGGNHVITDEMLQAAAHEANRAMMDSLPNPSECEHEFSQNFKKKMRKLIHETRHPFRTILLQRIACIFMIVVVACSTWLTIDVQARTAFLNWIREEYENFFVYRQNKTEQSTEREMDYCLSWLPDGFTLNDVYELAGSTIQTYKHDEKQQIFFSYSKNGDYVNYFVETSQATVLPVMIGEIEADFYRANDNNITNVLVWKSADGVTLFSISAFSEQDELIKMAEGVVKQKNK